MERFNSVDLYHKSCILKQHANHLLRLELEDCSIELYAWERFFIEQHADGQQQVTKINFADKVDMLKYLERIVLDDLGYPTVA